MPAAVLDSLAFLLRWARPDIQVALLDSNQKKAAFLKQAVADLQLRNATVVCERVEAWHADEKFDFHHFARVCRNCGVHCAD